MSDDASTPIAPVALTPDFGICKDVAAARNLIASMRTGYGRHNSREFERGVGGGLNIITRPSPFDVPPVYRSGGIEVAQHILTPARAIGGLDGHAIRERPQDCEVGDAVRGGFFDVARDFVSIADAWSTEFRALWTFERVRLRVTAPDRTYRDEYLWKRIE